MACKVCSPPYVLEVCEQSGGALFSAFSATGARSASTRTRLVHWLGYLKTEFEWFEYLGLQSYSAADIGSRIGSVLRAEGRLLWRSRAPYDLSFIHREASPASGGLQESLIRRKSVYLTYDLDDAIYLPGESRLTKLRIKKCTNIARTSDCVIAANEHLADWASAYADNVTVIPTCIDPADYVPRTGSIEAEGLSQAVVWLGSPSGEDYLQIVHRPLSRFLRESGLRLHVISSGYRSLGSLDPFVTRVEWSLELQRTLGFYAFGIAPLPATDFTIGKSAYKLLQYGAAGLPFVASPVGANEAVAKSIGGLLAQSESDWYEAFCSLLDLSDTGRGRLGLTMQALTSERFSYARWLPDWLRAVGLTSPDAG